MARRRGSPSSDVAPESRSRISGFLNPTSARLAGQRRGKALSDLEASLQTAEVRAASGEWAGADARTFVGLYAVCHRLTYKVLPLELENPAQFRAASRLALMCLHEHFADDADAFAEYVRWAWLREQKRAEWARSQNFDRNRLGWRLVFSARMVTDYAVTKAH